MSSNRKYSLALSSDVNTELCQSVCKTAFNMRYLISVFVNSVSKKEIYSVLWYILKGLTDLLAAMHSLQK